MPRFLGQHFLKNKTVIAKIIGAIDVQPNEKIIEIGPGHGELTIPLALAAQTIGGTIMAIETDEKLAEALAVQLQNLKITNVEIVHEDILTFFKKYQTEKVGLGHFKLVGNIPYYLTGHLLRVVGELPTRPDRAVFMIQREVGERLAAEPPHMNRLAASVQFWAEPKIIVNIAKEDFSPPPQVASVVIALETHSRGDATFYYSAVRMLFAQPRKTILNNLAATKAGKARIFEILEKLTIAPSLRPQDLSIKNISEIAKSPLFDAVHK